MAIRRNIRPARPRPIRRSTRPSKTPSRCIEALGFERGVIVHSSIYGSDHRLLLDTLEKAEPGGSPALSRHLDHRRQRQRQGAGALDAAGVCAARLNIAKMFGVTPSKSATQRTIDRIRELGWHVRVHVRGDDLLEFSDVLKGVHDIPMVIDHMGHVDLSKGLDSRSANGSWRY